MINETFIRERGFMIIIFILENNILELIVHDENHCLLDGHPLTVLFDVAKLQLGETICLTFPLDPKVRGQSCSSKEGHD
ncbi:Cytosolic phospholipase A2 epsilon, partial [Ophiophagus hannah]